MQLNTRKLTSSHRIRNRFYSLKKDTSTVLRRTILNQHNHRLEVRAPLSAQAGIFSDALEREFHDLHDQSNVKHLVRWCKRQANREQKFRNLLDLDGLSYEVKWKREEFKPTIKLVVAFDDIEEFLEEVVLVENAYRVLKLQAWRDEEEKYEHAELLQNYLKYSDVSFWDVVRPEVDLDPAVPLH